MLARLSSTLETLKTRTVKNLPTTISLRRAGEIKQRLHRAAFFLAGGDVDGRIKRPRHGHDDQERGKHFAPEAGRKLPERGHVERDSGLTGVGQRRREAWPGSADPAGCAAPRRSAPVRTRW